MRLLVQSGRPITFPARLPGESYTQYGRRFHEFVQAVIQEKARLAGNEDVDVAMHVPSMVTGTESKPDVGANGWWSEIKTHNDRFDTPEEAIDHYGRQLGRYSIDVAPEGQIMLARSDQEIREVQVVDLGEGLSHVIMNLNDYTDMAAEVGAWAKK